MALGIIEKSNNGLFENEIEFNGNYATMVRYLKETVGVFTTFREAYLVSAIVGYLNNAEESQNHKQDKVQSASIFPNELNKRKADLRFVFRVIMLSKDEEGLTIDDYMNRAFRDNPEDKNNDLKNCMLKFNSYVCGGLEFLYNKFKDTDKPAEVVDILYDYIHRFIIDVGFADDDDLPDFVPTFD